MTLAGMPAHLEADLPGTVSDAYALLTDEDFLGAYAQATGALSWDATVEDSRTHLRRTLPTDQVPSVLRGMVGDELEVTEQTDWAPPAPDGSRTAQARAVIALGGGAHFRGTIVLAPTDSGCRFTAQGTVDVKIPLVGGKLRGRMEDAVTVALRHQATLLAQRLG